MNHYHWSAKPHLLGFIRPILFLLCFVPILSSTIITSNRTLATENHNKIYLPYISIAAAPLPIPFGPTFSGEGTYYNATGRGTCMFDAIPAPRYVAAVNGSQFNGFSYNGQTLPPASLCGAYAQVTGPAGSVIVRLVDRCPECAYGDIDLSPEAFDQIAQRVQGRVPIQWRLVSMPITTPVQMRYKDGVSRYWTAVQVSNIPHPLVSIELWHNGQYVAVTRQYYNYFVRSGGAGPGYYTFRLTDIFGRQIIETSTVSLSATVFPNPVSWTGKNQFPQGQ
jgi:expansin